MHSKTNAVIHTLLANVVFDKGAAADVACDIDGKTVVRVCSGVNATHVLVGKNKCSLSAGEELVLSRGPLQDSDIYNGDGVGHRDCQTVHVVGLTLAHSEFSIPSLLASAAHRPGSPDPAVHPLMCRLAEDLLADGCSRDSSAARESNDLALVKDLTRCFGKETLWLRFSYWHLSWLYGRRHAKSQVVEFDKKCSAVMKSSANQPLNDAHGWLRPW